MAQNITISRTASARALLTALFAVAVLLVTRMAKNALEAIKTARQWLRAQHSFMAGMATLSSAPAGSSSATTSWQQ